MPWRPLPDRRRGTATVVATVVAIASGAMARPFLFDAHCHLQLRPVPFAAEAVQRAVQRGGVEGAAVCGCHASDWEKVQMLSREFPDFVVPSFGIHPWWAHRAAPGSDGAALRELLETIPTAGVGECGLDGGKKKEKRLWTW